MESEHNQTQRNNFLKDEQKIPRSPALRCANCDIEILWTPTIRARQTYCCVGCADGGPCTCDYSLYRSVNILGVIHYMPKHNQQ